jgi:hypothetical protein
MENHGKYFTGMRMISVGEEILVCCGAAFTGLLTIARAFNARG